MRGASLLTVMLIFCLTVTGCAWTGVASPPPAEETEAPVKTEIVLAAVGDIMMHNTQINAGRTQTAGEYDFSHFLRDISPYLATADLAVANLETTLAGAEKKYTGYPMFNSPDSLATALREAGFDIVTTANNHSLDRYEAGLRRTLDVLDEHGLAHTGTFRSPEERDAALLIETAGIKVAFLAYTYGTNGIPRPADKPYLVNLTDEALMLADAAAAQAAGADIVVICLHFGTEYTNAPSSDQKELVRKLIGAGADIILGSHPHVLQPYEKISAPTADGQTRDGWVVYSLGNFISGQTGLRKEAGVIYYFRITKDAGATTVDRVSYLPTWTHRYLENGRQQYRVVAVEKAVADYEAGRDSRLNQSAYMNLSKVWENTTGLLGEGLERDFAVAGAEKE